MIEGLKAIQRKDPIIATYNADSLRKDAASVDNTYSWHAATHIPLGETSAYLESLERWTYVNKGCFVGAIVGTFGYGKSSTAVHLWHECKQREILSIPPFSWRSLEEFVSGVYGWTKYCLDKVAPPLSNELAQIFERYRKRSIEELSIRHELSQETLSRMLDEGTLRLEFTPNHLLNFLEEVTVLILRAKFKGMVVFADELQVTLEAYPSRNRFFDDIFGLVNEILTRQGAYGIIFVMPSDTAALMADIRSDITQRLETCHLFARLDALYDRGFAVALWDRYATLFNFEAEKFQIVDPLVLDSLGQIASRRDLGAGPRSVIEAFVQIANYYQESRKTYTVTDLIDDYLRRRIAFDVGGKLVSSVTEALALPLVKDDAQRVKLIKALAAFPQGCPDSVLEELTLGEALGEALPHLFPAVVQRATEGYTLSKLTEERITERKAYVAFLREFVHRYAEDKMHAEMACEAFFNHILGEVFEGGRKDQLDKWTYETTQRNLGFISRELVGSFSEFNVRTVSYPCRNLGLVASIEQPDTSEPAEEFAFYFHLDWESAHEDTGSIKRLNEKRVLFRLNMLRRASGQLNIPFLSEMFPSEKVSPLFLLSAVAFLDEHRERIPVSELGEADLVCQRSVEAAIELLLGRELAQNSEFPLQFLGLRLPREVFLKLCSEAYPLYKTFVTSSHWQEDLRQYMQALKDQRIPLRVARGKEAFIAHKDVIGNIFFGGQPSKLAFQTFATGLPDLLEIVSWGGRGEDTATIRFKHNPLELNILEWLEDSSETRKKGQHVVKALFYEDVFDKATNLGYLTEEVGTALELLKLRKSISYDAKDKYLEQAVVSIDDMRDSLWQQLADLQKDVGLVKSIPEFNEEIYTERIPSLIARLEQVKEAEECEFIGEQVAKLVKGLGGWRSGYVGKMQAEAADAVNTAQRIITEGLPPVLGKEQKGAVSWVADLNMCRMILTETYNGIMNKLKKIAVGFKELETKVSLRLDTQSFIDLYSRKEQLTTELREQMTLLQAAKLQLGDYQKWAESLVLADDVYEEARKGAIAFNNPVFQDKLDSVFNNIHTEFTNRLVAALPDHEIFRRDIEAIKADLEGWTRKQRQEFLTLKERYESDLNSVGVQEYRIRTSFDSFNPSGSFQDLFQEVKEKNEVYLETLGVDLQQLKGEAFYVSEIHGGDVGEIPQALSEASRLLEELGSQLSTQVIERLEEWSSYIENVKHMLGLLQQTRSNLAGVAVPQEPSDDEKTILDLLTEPGGKDLRHIIMQLFQQEGEKVKLPDLLTLVQSLFRKLQITIRLYRKG